MSVEKSPLFTFAFAAFKRFVVNVLPKEVENPSVETMALLVTIVEP